MNARTENPFITPEGHRGFLAKKLFDEMGDIHWGRDCLHREKRRRPRKQPYAQRQPPFIVVDGEVRIISGDKEILAGKNQAVFVDGMTPHSIWNNGDQTATVIKISTKRPDSNGENARQNEHSLCDS